MSTKKKQDPRAPGSTTIAPGVLITIARLTSLEIPGVSGMASVPGGVNRLFRKGSGEGVRIEIENGAVSIDLFLCLSHGVNVRELSKQVQSEVAQAIEQMVGMDVTRIDVHIEEIDYPVEEAD
jgi:uncharacterized alkaline shock family protein YloU